MHTVICAYLLSFQTEIRDFSSVAEESGVGKKIIWIQFCF